MFDVAGGEDADIILEAGCGDGTIAVNICLEKKKDAKLVCCDIAERMCKIAAGKFDVLSWQVKEGDVLGFSQEMTGINSFTNSSWEPEKELGGTI